MASRCALVNWARALAVLGALVISVAPAHPFGATRYADLEWTFVRIKYHAWPEREQYYLRAFGKPCWEIDSPAAEQNLTRRVRSTTDMVVHDPIIGMPLEDKTLFEHPWIYFVEPGTLHLTDDNVATLREFLLRGGTATFDDFHGPLEWQNLEHELARVFPGRPIVDLQPPHPVFNCFYHLESYPQIPGLGSFLSGRTWEKGGYVPHLRTIYDDRQRAMVFINWNTDMGDGWEWSNAEDYPGYVQYTMLAYQMEINEIVYALTH